MRCAGSGHCKAPPLPQMMPQQPLLLRLQYTSCFELRVQAVDSRQGGAHLQVSQSVCLSVDQSVDQSVIVRGQALDSRQGGARIHSSVLVLTKSTEMHPQCVTTKYHKGVILAYWSQARNSDSHRPATSHPICDSLRIPPTTTLLTTCVPSGAPLVVVTHPCSER